MNKPPRKFAELEAEKEREHAAADSRRPNRRERRATNTPRVQTLGEWAKEKPDMIVTRKEVFAIVTGMLVKQNKRIAELEKTQKPTWRDNLSAIKERADADYKGRVLRGVAAVRNFYNKTKP